MFLRAGLTYELKTSPANPENMELPFAVMLWF